MHTPRAQYDADRAESKTTYSKFPTKTNPHILSCGLCNRSLYVDSQTYESATRAIEEGIDNPFLCDDCRNEHVELEHPVSH